MTHTAPQGLPVRDLTDDEKQFLHYNPNTSDLVEFVQAYAREALAAQAATLESIHKIIECAGPEAADEIADLLGYPSVEWPSDQAAPSPEQAVDAPVWNSIQIASWIGSQLMHEPAMFERSAVCKFVRSLGRHPTLLKHSPQPQAVVASSPSPASVQNASLVEKLAKRTCEANADSARFTIALQTLRASLDPDDWMGSVTMHNYIDAVLAGGSPLQQHPAPSPATAVDAVDELREALRTKALTAPNLACKSAQARLATQWGYVRAASVPVGAEDEPWVVFDSQGYYAWHSTEVSAKEWCEHYNARSADDPLKPYVCRRISECAALQASRQPQAQQAVAEGAGDGLRQTLIDVGRMIAWRCFGDCRAYDEFGPGSLRGLHEMDAEIRAALATKEHRS